MALQSFLRHWFRAPEEKRTAQQLERERYVLFVPRTGFFKRVYVVLPCLLVQSCIGAFYSWSIFNAVADATIWGTPGSNAKAFLAAVACYGLSTSILGAHIGRLGPFYAVRRSTVLVPLAWVLASLSFRLGSLPLLVIGFGLCHGPGTAHGYIATTSMMQKWFPEAKGAAAGLAVAGFSIGAACWSLLGKALMDPSGSYQLSPASVTLIFAAIFFLLLLVAVPFLRLPPPGWVPPSQAATEGGGSSKCLALAAGAPKPQRKPDEDYTLGKAAKQLEFFLVAVVVFGSSMPGVVFLSSAADMALNSFGVSPSTAGTLTALLNLVNFSGRVVWGLISDRVGRKSFYVLAAATQTISVGLMPLFIRNQAFELWALSFMAINSCYGGTFGVLPALCVELFGTATASATHGIFISLWSLSAVIGIPIFTSIVASNLVTTVNPATGAVVKHPAPSAYILNAEWLLALPLIATVCALLLTVNFRDRVLRKHHKHLRVRLPCSRVLTIKANILSKEDQHDEWIAYLELKEKEKEREGAETLKTGSSNNEDKSNTETDTAAMVLAAVSAPSATGESMTTGILNHAHVHAAATSAASSADLLGNPLVVEMSPLPDGDANASVCTSGQIKPAAAVWEGEEETAPLA